MSGRIGGRKNNTERAKTRDHIQKKERATRVKTWREMKANAKQTHLFLYKQ